MTQARTVEWLAAAAHREKKNEKKNEKKMDGLHQPLGAMAAIYKRATKS